MTLTLDANGGYGTSANTVTLTFRKGRAQTLPAVMFTKSGYAFSNWSEGILNSGVTFNDQQSVVLTHDTTLYAQWALLRNLSFDLNGGSGTIPTTELVGEGLVFKLGSVPSGTIPPAGKGFAGWTTNSTATGPTSTYVVAGSAGALSSSSVVMPNSDLTLHAIWVPVEWLSGQHSVYLTHSNLNMYVGAPYVSVEGDDLVLNNCNDPTYIPDGSSVSNSTFVPVPPGITIVRGDGLTSSSNVLVLPSSVREIGDEVFAYFHNASLTLPENVSKLSGLAFNGATLGTPQNNVPGMLDLYMTSEIPPIITGSAIFQGVFLGNTQGLTIHVPSAASEIAYKSAIGWSSVAGLITYP